MPKMTRSSNTHEPPFSLDFLELVNDLSDTERHVLSYFIRLFPTSRSYRVGVLTELNWLKQINSTLQTLYNRIFIHEANAAEREVLAGWIASIDRRITALTDQLLLASLAHTIPEPSSDKEQ